MSITISTTSPLTATVTLTNAQILALPTTPVTVVPAPGVGKLIQPVSVSMVMRKSVVYDDVNVAADIWLQYVGGAIATAGPGTTDGHLVFDTDTDAQRVEQVVNTAAQGALEDYENVAIEVAAANDSVDFTAGDLANSLTVSVIYHVLDV